MLFSLNVLDEMQDKFGGFDKMAEALEGKNGIRNLKWLLALVINEGREEEEEPLTEEQVGRMVHTGNLASIRSDMFKAFSFGNAGDPDSLAMENEEDEEDEAERKNAAAGEEK